MATSSISLCRLFYLKMDKTPCFQLISWYINFCETQSFQTVSGELLESFYTRKLVFLSVFCAMWYNWQFIFDLVFVNFPQCKVVLINTSLCSQQAPNTGQITFRTHKVTLCKIPKFHLISWCGNFLETHRKLGQILVFYAV